MIGKFAKLCMSIAFVLLSAVLVPGCKQEEPPPPAKPSVPPLAERGPAQPPRSMSSEQLPPGHPPVGETTTPTPHPAAESASPDAGTLPPGHPPIDESATPSPQSTADPASFEEGPLPPGHPPIGQPAAAEQPGADGLPPGHPPIGDAVTPSVDAKPIEPRTRFEGITLTPPEGWVAIDPGAGQSGFSAPVAVFRLPKTEGDGHDAELRLTYFPGMRHIPVEMNLERWFGQVRQPDGRSSEEAASRESFESNGVKVTMVDIPGTVGSMENWRMIAAEIDHPQGPHFLTVKGPHTTVEHWKESIVQYLRSAKVAE